MIVPNEVVILRVAIYNNESCNDGEITRFFSDIERKGVISPFPTHYSSFMRFKITPDFQISTDLLQFHFEIVPQLTVAQVKAQAGVGVMRLPETLDFERCDIQEWLNKALVEALRWQCHRLITPRLEQFAQRADVGFNRVVYKDVRSRWGSCSSLKNLNFSVWLLLAPPHLVDYVLCHELAHLTELNHSPLFWAELDRILEKTQGTAKCLDKEMNEFAKSLGKKGRFK